jgi:HK97 family phage major capsid protein
MIPSPSLDSIPKIARRTLIEANAQVRHVSQTASDLSLRELINGLSERPQWAPNQRALSAAYELSNACRQQTGIAPNGIWVPLSALTRDLTSAATPATSNFNNSLQAALAPSSAIVSGATLLSGLTGSSFSIPRIASPVDAAGSWVNEGNPGPQREPAFEVSTITPKSMIFELVLSRRLLLNASVDLEAELRAEILRQAMQEIDAAVLNGAGGAAPEGLLNNAGLQVLAAGANGAAPSWANLVEAEFQVASRVGSMRQPTFLTSPAVRKRLRLTQRAPGLGFIVSESADTLLGHQLRTSALVPSNLVKGSSGAVCSALLFGDLAEIFIGFWGPLALDLLIDDRTLATRGAVRILARAEVGVAVRNAGAFTAFKDFLTA